MLVYKQNTILINIEKPKPPPPPPTILVKIEKPKPPPTMLYLVKPQMHIKTVFFMKTVSIQ